MTIKEGKTLLRECFQQCKCKGDFDEMFYYTYGNHKCADGYQHPQIEAVVDFTKINRNVKFVVKCFVHLGVYVAWHAETGYGNGKFIAYRKDLRYMEENPDESFKTVMTEDGGNSYYFRGRPGINKFMEQHIKR